MKQGQIPFGRAEMGAALRRGSGMIAPALLFGTFANLLIFAGPLYMLQVYDRVLGARSVETLVALSLLVAFLYLVMMVLDHARARLMARAGTALHDRLGRRVFDAAMSRMAQAPRDALARNALGDLDALRMTAGAPVLMALCDLPWTPLFLAAIFVFHPLLGWAALAGGAILIALALLNQVCTRGPRRAAATALDRAKGLCDMLGAEAETVRAMGLHSAGRARWLAAQQEARDAGLSFSDRHAFFAAATRGFRLLLQSALLGLGAWLVLQDALSPGAMIAASILMGRALAPVELLIGQWATLQRAADAWRRLSRLLGEVPPRGLRLPLPPPDASLSVDRLTIVPPGSQNIALREISFQLAPGQALGVIGPSGAGKTTLARALAGICPPSAGSILLGGAPLGHYSEESRGHYIGYLAQKVALFAGSIAENIARLDPAPDPEAVIDAARRAGVHEMILSLPEGYDTTLGAGGAGLSGGQLQRIGLARALYGHPVMLILDEPNAHLDSAGTAALLTSLREARADGCVVVVMAHRPEVLRDCDLLMILEAGRLRALGPPDRILRSEVRAPAEVPRHGTPEQASGPAS